MRILVPQQVTALFSDQDSQVGMMFLYSGTNELNREYMERFKDGGGRAESGSRFSHQRKICDRAGATYEQSELVSCRRILVLCIYISESFRFAGLFS